MKRVLLHIIATSKYDRYIQGILDSARNHFLKDQKLEFVIYTDSNHFLELNDDSINKFHIHHEPWPAPTLKRFEYFSLAESLIKESDLSFYIDVDSLFVRDIDLSNLGINEDFKGMIGTLHPGYYGRCGTPERRPISLAYIPKEANNSYYCGGFFGGSSDIFSRFYFSHEI